MAELEIWIVLQGERGISSWIINDEYFFSKEEAKKAMLLSIEGELDWDEVGEGDEYERGLYDYIQVKQLKNGSLH